MRPPVIAGVDGSGSSQAAACLGAWEAGRRGCPLLLVHAVPTLPGVASLGSEPAGDGRASARLAATELLDRAAVRTHAGHPAVRVRTAVVAGSAAGGLVELSAKACLVVVGARGAGGFPSLSLGSVAAQVARHAHAPVLVARPAAGGRARDLPCPSGPASGPVIVGVDGSVDSAAALGFAFDEANARAAELIAVYAWWMLPLGNLGPTTARHYDPAQAQAQAQRQLGEAVAGWSEKYPDVPVRSVAEHSMNPAWALTEASRNAALLVVGSRGRGGFSSLLLGSTSQAVLDQAACPVAVVRPGGD